MKSSNPAELPDIAKDIPTTREDVEALRRFRIGNPDENGLALLLRLERGLRPEPPSLRTSEGWLPFEL